MTNYILGMQSPTSSLWKTSTNGSISSNCKKKRGEGGNLKIKRCQRHLFFRSKAKQLHIKINIQGLKLWGKKQGRGDY